MLRPPTESKRTDPLFPYTTPLRSGRRCDRRTCLRGGGGNGRGGLSRRAAAPIRGRVSPERCRGGGGLAAGSRGGVARISNLSLWPIGNCQVSALVDEAEIGRAHV